MNRNSNFPSSLKTSVLFLAAALSTANAVPESYDIVVYGGTSGGVAAAVQAARDGRSVVLVSPTEHLGGLTSSGLGWTDLGESSILGGISREFYHRVYEHYQDDSAWNWQTRASYGNAGQGGPAFDATNEIASVFEPKVAESIFDQWIAEESIPVITGRLDLDGGVVMDGNEIAHLRLEDGREYAGEIFIDASYEGDILPGAGVSFTVGRESNSTYNETVNGIQTDRATKNQLRSGIDPYVIEGDAGSGLLPGVEAAGGPPDGTGDDRLQAYCYRMSLTDVDANRVPIEQPEGYDEDDYELVFRSIEAGQTSGFFKFDLMPNRKTDSNNTGGISTDYIGKNYGPAWDWTTLNHDERDVLAEEHEQWQRGLVWTLQNHPRVPSSIRNNYAPWGLPADEFTDNDNWPYQLYVREARRMVSDYVMTQQHCIGVDIASDSIGLAAYSMDSHNVRRHVKDGMVKNEGDVQLTVANPYPVSYRSIVPAEGECPNLLVPWSLSASHMAFGSIRMEPVFMILSQSAAVAADMAIENDLAVQQVEYPELRQELLALGQALGDPVVAAPTAIVDNSDSALVTITGSWPTSSSTPGFVGSDYLFDENTGQGTKEVFYALPDGVSATQAVSVRWTSHENRASNVKIEIIHAGGISNVTVDQRSNGGKWNLLGIHDFTGAEGEGIKITNAGADGFVIADAVGFSPIDDDEDSDNDGLSDAREVILGLDPQVSNASLFEAIGQHPDYFGLHSQNEVLDFRMLRPSLSDGGSSNGLFQFSLEQADAPGDGSTSEDFGLNAPRDGDRRFYRLALESEPANFVNSVATGEPQTVVVYGTSLTANGAWVGEMRDWLSENYPGQVNVINSGLSGQNSTEGLAQLQSKVLTHEPDTVFIEFAMNDAFRYSDGTPSLDVSEAQANLEAIIDALQEQNPQVEIILQTMNTVWDSPGGSNQSATLRPNLADYYQMYRSVARDRGLRLIDHQPNWEALQEEDPATFQSYVADGVHPNATGLKTIMLPLLQWKLSGRNGQP